MTEPNDRYKLVYWMLLIIGIGTVLPFNVMSNAANFFADTKLNVTNPSETLSFYQKNLLTFMCVFSTLPNLILQAINLFARQKSSNIYTRIISSAAIQIILFVIIIILSVVDCSTWPELFFYLLMLITIITNSAGGLYQNSGFAITANLPMSYTNSILTGANLSGIFAALSNILSVGVSTDPLTFALVFFSIAGFFMTATIVVMIALQRNPFYQYYQMMTTKMINDDKDENDRLSDSPQVTYDGSSNDNDDNNNESSTSSNVWMTDDNTSSDDDNMNKSQYRRYVHVFRECWIECVSVFVTFYVSLLLYPSVQGLIDPTSTTFNGQGWLPQKYFSPIGCFLNFNLFATLGNAVTFSDVTPKIPKRFLLVSVLARIVFIPLFLFMNYLPDTRKMPVLIQSDWIYLVTGSAFGFTSGYLSSLCMMYAPKSASKPENSKVAAMMASFSMISGIVLGATSAFAMPYLVKFVVF